MRSRPSLLMNWKVWFGILISAGAIWWTFRDADFGRIVASLGRANWLIILLLVPLHFVGVALRAWRWSFFIGNDTSSFRSRYNAVSIGFMVTNLLPLRLGEIARALVFARNARRRRLEVLTTIAAERLFDLLALAILFVLVLPMIPIETIRAGAGEEADLLGLSRDTLMFGSIIFAASGLLGFLLLCQYGRRVGDRLIHLLGITRQSLRSVLSSFFDGIEALWRGRRIVQTLLVSLLIWLIVPITFWFGMFAFDSGETTLGAIVGLSGAIFLSVVVCAGIALPAVPGFFGVWHAAIRVAFIPYAAADKNAILAFAITIHLFSYLLTIFLGIEALRNEGVRWDEVREVEETDAAGDS